MESKNKKSVMTQVINVFILILVISALSGMTFLFVSVLKENTITLTLSDGNYTNESDNGGSIAHANETAYTLAQLSNSSNLEFRDPAITVVWGDANQSNCTQSGMQNLPSGYKMLVSSANYTLTGNQITNKTTCVFGNISVTYTYRYITSDDATAYKAVNTTERSGFQVTNYLTLLFLALIFGAVLLVVLRIILPYINVGKQIGNGF